MTEPKRDRYGRYLLPDPGTGKKRSWTRATTWAKTVADTYGLESWKRRLVAKGIASRPDLYAKAASLPLSEKKKLDEVADDALEYAGASEGRNLGDALHTATERLDRGEDVELPDPWNRDLKAYREGLAGAGLTVDPDYIERIVVCTQLGIAGTLDRIARIGSVVGRGFITDVKTGSNLSYSWNEISIQLAIYANADAIWTGEDYESMPNVDRERAIVVHLPAGQARCDLYWLDIAAGWEMAQLAGVVRAWRKRKDLATSFEVAS